MGGEPVQNLGGELQNYRAVVFPGQGTAGGEISGEVREAVRGYIGEKEVPYQLSVFAGSVDLLYKLRERGIEPDVAAGHSLGEYAAAHATGSLSLEDGVRLVAERDRLMNEVSASNPGVMVALIGTDPREVVEAVESTNGVVVAANFNTPRQTVISGEESAVEAVADKLKGRKVRLEVAGAFHSPLMRRAAEPMRELLAATEFREPEIPMVGGMYGEILATPDDIRLELQNQMLNAVRWVAVIERLENLGVEEIIEAGEDGTLIRMLRDFRDKEFSGKRAMEASA